MIVYYDPLVAVNRDPKMNQTLDITQKTCIVFDGVFPLCLLRKDNPPKGRERFLYN